MFFSITTSRRPTGEMPSNGERHPLPWIGDDLYRPSLFRTFDAGVVALGTVSGTVTGSYIGGVTTIEDECLRAG